MSFDEGYNPDMTSDEDFRAKFAYLLDEYQVTFSAMCSRSGVDESQAFRAISQGTYGLPGTATTLQRLLVVFGLGLEWLLSGEALRSTAKHGHTAVASPEVRQRRRRQLRALTWDFIIRYGIPRAHRRPLVEYVLSTLENRPTHTLLKAARPAAVPRTMTDVGYLYNQMKRDRLL